MRRIIIIVGAIGLVTLLLAASIFGYLKFKQHSYDVTSRECVDEAVPAIVGSWSKEKFFQYADSEIRNAASEDDFNKAFIKLDSMCGPLVRYEGAKGGSNTAISLRYRKVMVGAVYRANVKCARTNAIIDVQLTLTKVGWKISNFNVTTPGVLK